MKRLIGFFIVLVFAISACKQADLPELNLAGEWNYKLDRQETGEKEKWYNINFSDKILLPGALRDYNIGDEPTLKTDWTGSIYDSSWYFNPAMEKYRQPGSVKFPFWLTPVKHYKGIAWFQKEVEISASWEGKDIIVFLERPHWQTTVWIDSLEIGSDNSLSSPHRFVIPAATVSAGKHKLTIKVDNAIRDIDPGVNSSSLTDHTQGNWNGLVGALKMYPVSNVRIDKLKLIPSLANKSIQVDVKLNSVLSKGSLEFNIKGHNFDTQIAKISKDWEDHKSSMTFEIRMGDAIKTWSEFSPDLYEMTVSLKENSETIDTKYVQFGMREFTVNGKHFEINGIPVFLRGTTECSVFPLTGYPPTDKKEWTRIFNICKDFGLNHMRFHSYCPPEAAFCAADEAGIYLHVEGPSWAKYSTTLGDGKAIDDYLMKETKRILDTYGNHPSFVMMAYGNEPSGNYVPYLENWVDHFKAYDSQRVFSGMSSGRSWAIIENSDFIDRSPPRGLEWNNKQPESVFDYRNKTENQERPYVTFEMGQWCVFPNFDEIEKYTGSLKAKNFELFKEDLADHHMDDLADDFLMASGKLQASCYKQEIEATLRTSNLAGFQLLSLNDFSGQGSALVGVLDAFWDEKGYITANEFKRFCNDVVPLVCLPKFTFQANETLEAEVEIANFSGSVLENSTVKWKLSNISAEVLKKGAFESTSIPIGQNNKIATLEIPLNFVEKASQFTLSVLVGEYENNWKIWVYPVSKSEINKEKIVIAETPGPELEEALSNGKSVLLLAAGKVENGKDVVQYYVPAFWNTSWFRMRPPHTTGILIQNDHPVFDDFPTENYSDLQWWEISNRQQVMNLENFPVDFRPLVQPIDTWFMNRRLAMLFEAKVGNGKLMVCSTDLYTDLDERPVARQLKKSILNYMKSDQFVPETEIDYEVIKELFERKEREGWKSYVREDP